MHSKIPGLHLTVLICSLFLLCCNNGPKAPSQKEIVADPELMDERVAENIRNVIDYAVENMGKVDDSLKLRLADAVQQFYNGNGYQPAWSKKEIWLPLADSLFRIVANAEREGMFPEDYHAKELRSIRARLDGDSLLRMDATIWARADVILTDAFLRMARDHKYGRITEDSIIERKPEELRQFLVSQLDSVTKGRSMSAAFISLQPTHAKYWELKAGIPSFLDSMDRKIYTYLSFPFKKGDIKDSVFFTRQLQKRLKESGMIQSDEPADSTQLSAAIKKYQQQKGLKADGKPGPELIKRLNSSDLEKFKQIAITLDRYKQLPAAMPEKYIWVNLPGYYLQVWQKDSLVFESKVIIGKPGTRTPILSSDITDIITYPTWTVPTSIIAKEILPGLKRNPGYLARKGLGLFNNKGERIDPATINWAKYSKGIPFKVMQASGDGNALGIIKFNFNNPYAVYLHDTNQRYLFKNASRALSHGCVRVQEWEKLAYYIARNDSMNIRSRDTLRYNTDSIRTWIAKKERHRIDVKNKIPLFIRYFSCEGQDGKLRFYDDIYGEDKQIREKYFTAR